MRRSAPDLHIHRRQVPDSPESDDWSKEIVPWLSSSGTLLAEIAVRTALALQEGAGWAICSNPECRRLYRPRRHVAEGRLHFCNNCGKRASWRLSKRRKSAGVS